MNLNHYCTLYTKINWFIHLNIRDKSLKPLEENLGEHLWDLKWIQKDKKKNEP